jgi:hypothetical protein
MILKIAMFGLLAVVAYEFLRVVLKVFSTDQFSRSIED